MAKAFVQQSKATTTCSALQSTFEVPDRTKPRMETLDITPSTYHKPASFQLSGYMSVFRE